MVEDRPVKTTAKTSAPPAAMAHALIGLRRTNRMARTTRATTKNNQDTTATAVLAKTSTARTTTPMSTCCVLGRALNHPHHLLTNSGIHPPLFTELRRVCILGSSDAGSCISRL